MTVTRIVLTLACVYLVQAQRPFYAGLSAIGYPAVQSVDLSNRFGEAEDAPIEARGDRNLINRLNQLPVDKQPFWYINAKQYDALRQKPISYPQRQNSFVDRIGK